MTTTAGCLSPGSLDDYALVASTELEPSLTEPYDPPYLWPDPTDIEATTRVDFTDETKAQYVSELFETGTLTVQQWPLVMRNQWGNESVPRRTFLQRDGRFYEVQIDDERRLDRERWHFAVERVDEEPPGGATIEHRPFDLSTRDERVLEAALDAVYEGGENLGGPEFDERRTVEYHQGLDARASELVPSPPFEFVRGTHDYFRPVTERRTVRVPEWTYTVDEVAETRAAFTEYAWNAVVEDDLSDSDLSQSARGVIEDALSGDARRYEESAPPSDELSEVLEALGIARDLQPIDAYDDRVDFRGVVAEYDNAVYQFALVVTPPSTRGS
jgi:hypothetical protein